MIFPRTAALLIAVFVAAGLAGCASDSSSNRPGGPTDALEVVAEFDTTQITGVAVSGSGRTFVNAPYWTEPHGPSVLEVMEDGSTRPYPNAEWNVPWAGEGTPAEQFVCVQSVYVDPQSPETLWILDPASPKFAGVVDGGAKLVEVDLTTDTVTRTIAFSPDVAPTGSYLNDVRVTADQSAAIITDSNLGALVVVDLESGTARRVLDDHPSTAADSTYVLRVEGDEFRNLNGQVPQIASDGIAISPGDEYVYYHALTGTRLYRVPTAALTDADLPADSLAAQVEDLGDTVVTDGMIADGEGRIYHSALEVNGIARWTPGASGGTLDTLVTDPRLKWPDSFALGPDGDLYVTTSQIHLMPQYNRNIDRRTQPYRIFRYALDQ